MNNLKVEAKGIDFNKYKQYLMKLPIRKIVDILNRLNYDQKYYAYSDEKLRELLNIKPTDSLLYVYKKFKELFDKDLIDTDGEVITCVSSSSLFTVDNRDYVCKRIISILTNEFEERNEDFEKWFNNLGIDSPLKDCFKK